MLLQVRVKGNETQSIVLSANPDIPVVFGPGAVVSRHFVCFFVLRLNELERAMSIFSASSSYSADDYFDFRYRPYDKASI